MFPLSEPLRKQLWNLPLLFPREGDFVPVLILLAVGAWLARKLRPNYPQTLSISRFFGVATLFAYGALDLSVHQPQEWDFILGSMMRAFLAAGVVLVSVGITVPILAVLYRLSLGAIFKAIQRWLSRLRRGLQSWHQRAAQEKRERDTRAENERMKREAQVRHTEEEVRRISARGDQTRRENARAEVQLFVASHATELPAAFGPTFITEFLKTYLSDMHPPDLVESQAARLIATMNAALESNSAKKGAKTIDDLTAEFELRQGEIEALPISPEMKQHLQFKLRKQLSENIERLGGL